MNCMPAQLKTTIIYVCITRVLKAKGVCRGVIYLFHHSARLFVVVDHATRHFFVVCGQINRSFRRLLPGQSPWTRASFSR